MAKTPKIKRSALAVLGAYCHPNNPPKMLFPQSIIGVAILKRTMGWSRTLFI